MRIISILLFFLISTNIFSQHFYQTKEEIVHSLDYRILNNVEKIPNYYEKMGRHSVINLTGQLLVGSVSAVISPIVAFIPIGLLLNASRIKFDIHDNGSSIALAGILLSSYIFGAGLGVYWIAQYENKNMSFWKTITYSVIGAGVGAITLTILAANNTRIPPVGGVFAALTPILGAMVYSSFVSDWHNEKVNNRNKGFSHIDLFENEKLFKLKILQITF